MGILIVKNNTSSDVILTDLRSFEVTASGTETLSDYFSVSEMANSGELLLAVADNTFTVNNGTEDLTAAVGAKHCLGTYSDVNLLEELRDTSGKLRVHQTSRKIGLRITWTGAGDDQSDPHAVGGGERFSMAVASGTVTKYVDFNCVNNETWLHEGYLTWDKCSMDLLTLEMVPRVASYTVSSGTNYNSYGGYMVIPAAGDGIINITSDLTDANGGLVYMPNDDEGNLPTAFWDADWNTSTKQYENITPAPYGTGRYNIFIYEITFARFVNEVPFLANGFIPLNSSDTDQLGHGMRLRMTLAANGNTETSYIACIMCLHRKKSV